MLGVIAIIGILMAVIAPSIAGIMDSAEGEVNKLQGESIKSAILSAYLDSDAGSLDSFLDEVFIEDSIKFNLIDSYLQGSIEEDTIDGDVVNYVKDSFGW